MHEHRRIARFGEHDLRTVSDGMHEDIVIARSKKHPQYNRMLNTNDVAIITLSRDVKFTGTGLLVIIKNFRIKI